MLNNVHAKFVFCPNCDGKHDVQLYRNDIYECMFLDAIICVNCYVTHMREHHPECLKHEGWQKRYKACKHGWPKGGACRACRR